MSTFNLRDGGLAQVRLFAKLALCQSLFFAGTADDVADLFGITSQLHNAKNMRQIGYFVNIRFGA
jgi:hypothetical protein